MPRKEEALLYVKQTRYVASLCFCSRMPQSSFQMLTNHSQNQNMEKQGNVVIKTLKMAGLQGKPLK